MDFEAELRDLLFAKSTLLQSQCSVWNAGVEVRKKDMFCSFSSLLRLWNFSFFNQIHAFYHAIANAYLKYIALKTFYMFECNLYRVITSFYLIFIMQRLSLIDLKWSHQVRSYFMGACVHMHTHTTHTPICFAPVLHCKFHSTCNPYMAEEYFDVRSRLPLGQCWNPDIRSFVIANGATKALAFGWALT